MSLLENARRLRRDMTHAERLLWAMLRNRTHGHKFRRQVPRGPYILDFACLSRRVVVELDGRQHCESAADSLRDAWLDRHGFRVLRFTNEEMCRNPEGVLYVILSALETPPHPASGHLLPHRGEGSWLFEGFSDEHGASGDGSWPDNG